MIGLVLDCLVKKADDCNQALQSFGAWFGLGLGLRFVVILEFKKTAKMGPRRVPGGSRGPSGELKMSLGRRQNEASEKAPKTSGLLNSFSSAPNELLGRGWPSLGPRGTPKNRPKSTSSEKFATGSRFFAFFVAVSRFSQFLTCF